MKTDLFDSVTVEHAKRERLLGLPPAATSVIIFFTPRSGSSWLTDILVQTGQFGRANELFNPNFMPNIARSLHADNLDTYCEVARKKFNVGGVFCFEITSHQMNAVFENQSDFHQRFGNSKFVWLVRRDIVAQAVSLAKMVNVQVSHSPQHSDDDISGADQRFTYSSTELRKWLFHIRTAEVQAERFFSTYKIQPLRLSYEDMVSAGPEVTANGLFPLANATLPADFSFVESHKKVGTPRNKEFADAFKRQHWLLNKRLSISRQWMLRKLAEGPLATHS